MHARFNLLTRSGRVLLGVQEDGQMRHQLARAHDQPDSYGQHCTGSRLGCRPAAHDHGWFGGDAFGHWAGSSTLDLRAA